VQSHHQRGQRHQPGGLRHLVEATGDHRMGIVALFVALVVPVGPATVDWQRGVIEAEAATAGSLRAPNPAIARVSAERTARHAAARKLLEAVEKLPLA